MPIAANASYYAEIVREKAILRRLVSAGTRIVQMGYAGEGMVDDAVDAAQQEVYQVTDKRTSEDYAPLSAIMEGTLDEIEAISNRGGEMTGVPTGFADLDELTNGLHGGQMVIIAARPAVGKALALDTALPTPTGWTTMGEVAVGDQLLDAEGHPTRVVAATRADAAPPLLPPDVLRRLATIVADWQHQWVTRAGAGSPSATGSGVVHGHHGRARAHASRPATPIAMPDGASSRSRASCRSRPCRCAACRSTTTTTSTSPGRPASRPTTRRWRSTCAGPRASTTTRPRSSSASR